MRILESHSSLSLTAAVGGRFVMQMHAGPVVCLGRSAYLYFPTFPASGGFPFERVEHNGSRYTLVGRGFFSPEETTPAEISALYDFWCERYDEHHPWVSALGSDIAELIHARHPGPAALLDACCGTGQLTLACLTRLRTLGVSVSSVSLVDLSRGMLAVAGRRLAEYHPRIYCGDYIDCFPGRVFDVVICSLAADHFNPERWHAAIATIGKHLAPGARGIIVLTPSRKTHRERRDFIAGNCGECGMDTRRYISAEGIVFNLELYSISGKNSFTVTAI